jgi:hypothetical protein
VVRKGRSSRCLRGSKAAQARFGWRRRDEELRTMTRSGRWDVGSRRGWGGRQQDRGGTDDGRQGQGGACVMRMTAWSKTVSSGS